MHERKFEPIPPRYAPLERSSRQLSIYAAAEALPVAKDELPTDMAELPEEREQVW